MLLATTRAWARAASARLDSRTSVMSPMAHTPGWSTTYTPGTERIILPLGPGGGASQILRDGVRVVVGPEETSKIKGEDLFLGFIRQELGVESEA